MMILIRKLKLWVSWGLILSSQWFVVNFLSSRKPIAGGEPFHRHCCHFLVRRSRQQDQGQEEGLNSGRCQQCLVQEHPGNLRLGRKRPLLVSEPETAPGQRGVWGHQEAEVFIHLGDRWISRSFVFVSRTLLGRRNINLSLPFLYFFKFTFHLLRVLRPLLLNGC